MVMDVGHGYNYTSHPFIIADNLCNNFRLEYPNPDPLF